MVTRAPALRSVITSESRSAKTSGPARRAEIGAPPQSDSDREEAKTVTRKRVATGAGTPTPSGRTVQAAETRRSAVENGCRLDRMDPFRWKGRRKDRLEGASGGRAAGPGLRLSRLRARAGPAPPPRAPPP